MTVSVYFLIFLTWLSSKIVGDEDVTFEVDMMDEESDGVENSEDDDEDEEDDDLDPPSGGEEQHVNGVDNTGPLTMPSSRPISATTQSSSSRREDIGSLSANTRNVPEIRAPHSPALDTGGAGMDSAADYCKLLTICVTLTK